MNDLLEIYKLHAELADRVSQRRIEASKIFVSVLLGMLALLGLDSLVKTRFEEVPAI